MDGTLPLGAFFDDKGERQRQRDRLADRETEEQRDIGSKLWKWRRPLTSNPLALFAQLQIWARRTNTIQSIAATVLALLMDRKNLSYGTLVTDIWPEYGQHGKQNTTINHIVLHQVFLHFAPKNSWTIGWTTVHERGGLSRICSRPSENVKILWKRHSGLGTRYQDRLSRFDYWVC